MPKIYLTMDERKRAEATRYNHSQDGSLRLELLKAKKSQRATYITLAEKSKVSVSTVQKIFDVNQDLGTIELNNLRSVCCSLGVKLKFCTE